MLRTLIHWLLSALILMWLSAILPGIQVHGLVNALIATFVLSLMNAIIKPILTLITLPITFLTLGLFALVINGIVLMLTAWVVPGFEVTNWLSAIVAAILFSILTGVINALIPAKKAHT